MQNDFFKNHCSIVGDYQVEHSLVPFTIFKIIFFLKLARNTTPTQHICFIGKLHFATTVFAIRVRNLWVLLPRDMQFCARNVLQQKLLWRPVGATLCSTSAFGNGITDGFSFSLGLMSGVVKTLHEFPSKYDGAFSALKRTPSYLSTAVLVPSLLLAIFACVQAHLCRCRVVQF